MENRNWKVLSSTTLEKWSSSDSKYLKSPWKNQLNFVSGKKSWNHMIFWYNYRILIFQSFIFYLSHLIMVKKISSKTVYSLQNSELFLLNLFSFNFILIKFFTCNCFMITLIINKSIFIQVVLLTFFLNICTLYNLVFWFFS